MPLATRGLYMEDGVNHVSGVVLPRTSSLVHFSKVFGQHLPLLIAHAT